MAKQKNKGGGRPRAFSKEKLRDIFELNANEIINHEEKKVQVPGENIYSKIQAEHKINMSTKAIYNDARAWYAEKTTSEPNEQLTDNSLEQITDDSSEDGSINFRITLSADEWSQIKPNSTQSTQLKADFWTEVLIDKIADHPLNIICDIAFKRSKVTPNGENYANVYGNCATCAAVLHGYVDESPEPENVVHFNCSLKGYNEEIHRKSKKNVKVTGSQAKKLAESKTPAVVLHREMASKSGEMFVKPKGRNPSANAIRNMQSRNHQKDRLSTDVLTSLQLMQNLPQYRNEIHQVLMQPFGVIYGSPNQFLLYEMHKKKSPVLKIFCDATGSLVRKLSMYYKQLISISQI